MFDICFVVDHTRVKLRDGDETIPGYDYINANHILVSETGFLHNLTAHFV